MAWRCAGVAFEGTRESLRGFVLVTICTTDSLSHRVMRVPAAELMNNSDAQEWSSDPRFVVDAGQFGLNGILWDGSNDLFTVNFAKGALYRIPIAEDGSPGTLEVIADDGILAGPDGIERLDSKTLLIVEGGKQRFSRFDIATKAITVIQEQFDFPTTAAIVGNDAWVVEGQLDHLLGMHPAPPTSPFVVTKVSL